MCVLALDWVEFLRTLKRLMKARMLFLSAVCLVASCLIQTHAATTNGCQVTVELQDGSRVVGKASDVKFEFHSDILGEIKLPLEQIDSIECQPKTNAVKLTVANGDKLVVSFLTSEIRVETSFGNVKIPADSVRRVQVSATGVSGRTRAGLVALWSGEGNANDSVGNCNGQLMNGVGFAPGKVGQAFDLNENFNNSFGVGSIYSGGLQGGRFNRGGGGGFVLIPSSPALDVGKGDGFTFECWVKPTTKPNNVLFEFERTLGSSNGLDIGMLMAIQNHDLYINIIDASQDHLSHELATPPNLVAAGVWQHIAVTYDKASGMAVFYINGVAIVQANLGSFTPQTSFANLCLGARTIYNSVSNPDPGSTFSGGMDEIGIYNRALSASEIQAICTDENNGQPLPAPSVSNGQMSSDDSSFHGGLP